MRHRTPTMIPGSQAFLLHTAVLAALLMVGNPAMPLLAQGIDSEKSIDAIVDAPVETKEKPVSEEQGRIVAAIENSRENASQVRKLFNINKLEIVFVPELKGKSSPVSGAIEKHDEDIEELRDAIEGSALFYHAIDSRSVLLRDVIAVEFGEDNALTVFTAGADPEK